MEKLKKEQKNTKKDIKKSVKQNQGHCRIEEIWKTKQKIGQIGAGRQKEKRKR